MRPILRLCLAAVLLPLLSNAAPAPHTVLAATPISRLDLPWWRTRHEAKLAELRAHPADLIFLGDSITQGGGGAQGYITLVKKALDEKDKDLGIETINAGISGNKVPDLQRRVEKDVIAKKPAIVFIYIGINDVWHGQNDPADIPELLALLRSGNDPRIAMIAGVRVNRQDASNRRFVSGFANAFRRRMLNDGATDSGCGLKAFRREAYLALPYFDHMHRFLIALMRREGYEVREAPVNHRPRRHGRSKYGNFHRALVGLVDTFGVRWLQKRFGGPVEPKEI